MVNVYKYNDNTQLVEHFNVSEFKCKCGGTHDTKINPELPEKLEQLFKKLDCSMIIVNSGYRCPTHSLNVGGYATDYHTKGYAADIVCYDKLGNKISSKKVCCAAQDLGFGGIANIKDSDYTATHVDVRTSNFWKGDENVSNSTVCEDFYKYFNLSKEDVYGKDATSTLDVSITVDGKTYTGTLTEK